MMRNALGKEEGGSGVPLKKKGLFGGGRVLVKKCAC
jgi:hypothetical protein